MIKFVLSIIGWITFYIIIFFAVIIGITAFFAYALGTFEEHHRIKLSRAEKQFVENLSKDCECSVRLRHSTVLIRNSVEGVSWKKMQGEGLGSRDTIFNEEDYTLSLEFVWYKGENDGGEPYYHNLQKDICFKDSTTRYNYAQDIANQLLKKASYLEHYKFVKIYYETREHHPRIEWDICRKNILFKIKR